MTCKNICPVDLTSHTCCAQCKARGNCASACPDACKYKECDEYSEEVTTDVVAFKTHQVQLIDAITKLENQRKKLDEQSKIMREKLQAAMEEYGVTKFDNGMLKLTYVAPTTRSAIDSTKLKKELPEVAEKYTKVSNVKASIRLEVK